MPKHDVSFEIPTRPLGRADVSFRVKQNECALGTLTVSNGSVVWFPRGTHYGYKMKWERFGMMMRESVVRSEKR